jgi:hypothetical protein
MDAKTKEELYAYNKDVYDNIVRLFLENDVMKKEIEFMKQKHPNALYLVCENWEEVLKNSAIYKHWNSTRFNLYPYERSKNYQFNYFPKQYQLKLLVVIGEINFDRSSPPQPRRKQQQQQQQEPIIREQGKNTFKMKQTGPIEELLKAYCSFRKKKYYNYASVKFPDCGMAHRYCGQQSMIPTKNTFCCSIVRFYNGNKISGMTPAYLEWGNFRNLIGVCVVNLVGITCFNENFETLKLSGEASTLSMSSYFCMTSDFVQEENTDDFFDVDYFQMKKPKFVEDSAAAEGEQQQYGDDDDDDDDDGTDVKFLIPENMIQPPDFSTPYKVTKKKLAIQN